jgi:hypothetical protein
MPELVTGIRLSASTNPTTHLAVNQSGRLDLTFAQTAVENSNDHGNLFLVLDSIVETRAVGFVEL